jgi:glycine oxidase
MHSSIWFQTLSEDQRRLLETSDALPKTADIAIVGAGMIGLAAAWYLSAAGVSNICVIDRDAALAEASGANAGGLWFAQQSPELGPLSPLAHASSRLYDELAAQWDCDIRRTGLVELLYENVNEAEAGARIELVRAAGFQAERAGAGELQELEPALAPGPAGAIFYPDEGQVHPAKLALALVSHLRDKGVRFCFGCAVERLRPRLETSRGALDARVAVIAAGAWTPLLTKALGWSPPIKPMRGQLLATTPVPPLLRHTIVARQFYYWQLTERHVAGGGTVEDVGFAHGTRIEDLAAIREEMNALFPALREIGTACAWSGFRPYCQDLRPVLGKVPGHENLYVAAGHFKKGIMLAPVTGKILADLITSGKTDLPIAPLDPARFPERPA